MTVHARIDNPLELRKDVLESAIFATDGIRSSLDIKELGKQKKKLRTQMIHALEDLKKSVKSFERKLPPLPKETKLQARREDLRDLMMIEKAKEMGGPVKPIEKVRKELKKIKSKKKKPGDLRKRAVALSEKEKLRKELTSIRSRIDKLNKILPKR